MTAATVRTPAVEFTRRDDVPQEDGDNVLHKGVIFRAGDYSKSHGFTMTREELAAVARDFKPVPITHGHPGAAGPLDDDLGEVRAVELSADGNDLIGTVALRKWLSDKLRRKAARLSVSSAFDRFTKRLKDLSLVTYPAITDAELMAAFSADAASRTDDPALLKETIKALAAFCACQAEQAPTPRTVEAPMPTKKEQLKQYLDSLADDADVDDGAASMILFPDAGEGDDMADDDGIETTPAPTQFSADPEAIALRAEIESLKAERRREKAALFAAEMKGQGRIRPYEEKMAEAAMFTALTDDALSPRAVTFAVGDKAVSGSREAMVRADYGQREARQYGPQIAAGTGGTALAQFGGDAPETPEQRRARLDARLANTSTGRAILARRNGNAHA